MCWWGVGLAEYICPDYRAGGREAGGCVVRYGALEGGQCSASVGPFSPPGKHSPWKRPPSKLPLANIQLSACAEVRSFLVRKVG